MLSFSFGRMEGGIIGKTSKQYKYNAREQKNITRSCVVNLIISTGYDAFYELNIPGCCTSAAGGRMRTSYLIERGDNGDVKGGSALTQMTAA